MVDDDADEERDEAMMAGLSGRRASRLGFAGFAVMALVACAGESVAGADRDAAANGGNAATAAGASANLAQQGSQATPRLPIEPGLYVLLEDGAGCAGAELFFYDGENVGDILAEIPSPDGSTAHSSSSDRIIQVGAPRRARLDPDFARASRGYTLVWTPSQSDTAGRGEVHTFAIQPTGPGGFRRLRVEGGRLGVEYVPVNYRKCAFGQLSPQMQAAIRDQQPHLAAAPATTANVNANANAPRVDFPPIPQGYYARNQSCRAAVAEAVAGDPEALNLFSRSGLWDLMGGIDIRAFEPLGANRFRVRAQMSDENGNPSNADFVMTVTGAGSFTKEAVRGSPAERYTHCPDNQIPRQIRAAYRR